MKKTILVFFLFLNSIFCQSNVKFDFDFAQFQYDSTNNYLEIYYAFYPADFKTIKEDGQTVIKAKMTIQIQNSTTDELVVNKDWKLTQPMKDTADYKNGKSLLGVVGFNLKTGSYSIDISIEDILNQNARKEFTENINIIPFSRRNFAISDIELATRIINENANKNSIFYKNTLEVFPNPSIVYSDKSPVLFYYSEIYNLQNISAAKVILERKLYDSKNNLVYENSKEVQANKTSIVEVGIVSLKKFPTDTYTFVIKLIDSKSKQSTTSSKKFYFVNPGIAVAKNSNKNPNYINSEFGVMELEECDDLFEKSKFIAEKFEIDEYKKLDSIDKKREFLFNFWKKRDESPETQSNEFKKIYLSRVEISNSKYKFLSTSGFKTDRGRVYILYGEPDEIDRFPNETDTKPYEIWAYNDIEGGVIFIFGDFSGYGNYELIHSTKRGEIQDPNWLNRISAN